MRKSMNAIIATSAMLVATSASANNIQSTMERVYGDMSAASASTVNNDVYTSTIAEAVKRITRSEQEDNVVSGVVSYEEAAKTL